MNKKKHNRKEEISYFGANATREAYQQGLADFNALTVRLKEMKQLGFIENYSFGGWDLWITKKNWIERFHWHLGLDEINNWLDEITPKREKITGLNTSILSKGDWVEFQDGVTAEFIRWSWLDGDCAVFTGLSNNKVSRSCLVGATRIPKHEMGDGR